MANYLGSRFELVKCWPDIENIIALYFLLIGCILGLSIFVPPFIGRIVALLGLGASLAVITDIKQTVDGYSLTFPIQFRPIVYYSTIILWTIFLIGVIRAPSLRAVLHTGAFIAFSGVALFVIPAAVPRERAFTAIATLGAISILISLPAVIWGEITIAGYTLSQTVGTQRSVIGFNYWAPGSIYDSRNYFRVLVALGTVCAAALFVHKQRQWIVGLFFLNILGVVLTEGRAAILTIFIVILLVAAYIYRGPRALAYVTLVGVGATFVGFAIAFGILPGPNMAIQSALGQRTYDWLAGYQAFLDRPVIGWGILGASNMTDAYHPGQFTGIHTSYLRMFVIGGSVGGLTYLVLCGSAIWFTYHAVRERTQRSFLSIRNQSSLSAVFDQNSETGFLLGMYCLVVMVLVFQLFDGATIFGANISSVLWALVIGYGQSIPEYGSRSKSITISSRRVTQS